MATGRPTGPHLPSTTSVDKRLDWYREDLAGTQHDQVAFVDGDLSESTTANAAFTGCVFRDCSFNGSTHTDSAFTNCAFVHCDLADATFADCKLVGATFDRCTLNGLTVTGGDWSFVTLARCRPAPDRLQRCPDAGGRPVPVRASSGPSCAAATCRPRPCGSPTCGGATCAGPTSPPSIRCPPRSPAPSSIRSRRWVSRQGWGSRYTATTRRAEPPPPGRPWRGGGGAATARAALDCAAAPGPPRLRVTNPTRKSR